MAEGKENNNVYDFTAHRIASQAKAYADAGDTDAANTLWNALQAYLRGLCDIRFIGGETYIVDDAEGKENNNT